MATAMPKSATLTLSVENQNIASINNIVKTILKRAGCAECGRLALVKFDFHVNPARDLLKEGVLSAQIQGL